MVMGESIEKALKSIGGSSQDAIETINNIVLNLRNDAVRRSYILYHDIISLLTIWKFYPQYQKRIMISDVINPVIEFNEIIYSEKDEEAEAVQIFIEKNRHDIFIDTMDFLSHAIDDINYDSEVIISMAPEFKYEDTICINWVVDFLHRNMSQEYKNVFYGFYGETYCISEILPLPSKQYNSTLYVATELYYNCMVLKSVQNRETNKENMYHIVELYKLLSDTLTNPCLEKMFCRDQLIPLKIASLEFERKYYCKYEGDLPMELIWDIIKDPSKLNEWIKDNCRDKEAVKLYWDESITSDKNKKGE